MGKAPEADPMELYTPRSRRVLFLQIIKGHKTIHCKSLWWYLKELVHQGFFREYVLTPGAAASAGQPSAPFSTQLQHAIA